MRVGTMIAALAILSGGPAGAARAEALSGAAAFAAILGNTVSGTTPDGPYDEFFMVGGTVVHRDRDGRAVGQWTLREDRVCLQFPEDDQPECRVPRLEGAQGAFVDADGTPYGFDLLPGNPKGL